MDTSVSSSPKPVTIRSHYRICMRPTFAGPGKFPLVPASFSLRPPTQDWQEVCFTPASLVRLCVESLLDSGRCGNPSIPQHIQELIRDISSSVFLQQRARQSGTEQTLQVGNFGEFRGILEEPNRYCFSTNLVDQAQAVLRMLAEADKLTTLENEKVMSFVMKDRYPKFLLMQSAHPDVIMVPPLDIQTVWWSHCLQSEHYHQITKKLKIEHFPHCVCRGLSTEEKSKGEKQFRAYWKISYNDPIELSSLAAKASPSVAEFWQMGYIGNSTGYREYLLGDAAKYITIPTTKDFIADRMWYREFLKATDGSVIDETFLRRCQVGYQRYMYLMAKYRHRLEAINFAPPPTIDLFWHTHLAQPEVYRRDCLRLIRHIPHHKLLPEYYRTLQTYDARTSEEEKLWKEEFKESLCTYAN